MQITCNLSVYDKKSEFHDRAICLDNAIAQHKLICHLHQWSEDLIKEDKGFVYFNGLRTIGSLCIFGISIALDGELTVDERIDIIRKVDALNTMCCVAERDNKPFSKHMYCLTKAVTIKLPDKDIHSTNKSIHEFIGNALSGWNEYSRMVLSDRAESIFTDEVKLDIDGDIGTTVFSHVVVPSSEHRPNLLAIPDTLARCPYLELSMIFFSDGSVSKVLSNIFDEYVDEVVQPIALNFSMKSMGAPNTYN